MDNSSLIKINMLGGFSISYGQKLIGDETNRSKKMWSLLEYLIIFRNRIVLKEELIEMMWSNQKNANSDNAFKTLLHRVRAILSQLDPNMEFIIQRRGVYYWNNLLPISIDVDEFENLCKEAGRDDISREEALGCYLKAIDIYKGSFLPKSMDLAWVVSLNAHYRGLYNQAVQFIVEYLLEKEKYHELVDLCKRVIAIDPYEEYFHYNLIYSLIKLDDMKAAKNQYEQVCDLFYSKFGVSPSKELMALYKEVIKVDQNMETDLNIIKKHLNESGRVEGAFFCQYEIFKSMYQVQARSVARTGHSIYLILITVCDPSGDLPKLKYLNSSMQRVSNCIRRTLRRGDIYSRYSTAQYIIMLPMTSYENAELVADRIVKRYKKENTRSAVVVKYKIQPIDPIMDEVY